jgi:hypothetical protein
VSERLELTHPFFNSHANKTPKAKQQPSTTINNKTTKTTTMTLVVASMLIRRKATKTRDLLFLSPCSVHQNCLGGRAPRSNKSYRYFSQEISLPALRRLNPASNNYGDSIPVLYTNDPQSASQWMETHFSQNDLTTVGWDVESVPNVPWMPANFCGPATVQISVVHAALVVQMVNHKGFPSEDTVPMLRNFLADPSILKAGVGIDKDMMELVRSWDPESSSSSSASSLVVRGRMDIGGIGAAVGRTRSLKDLAFAILGVDIPKSRKLSLSNWGQVPLTTLQIAYAARDAWVAAAIMNELALRDPNTCSTQSLLQLVSQDEISISDLDRRAVARKMAKTEFEGIVGGKGEEKVDRRDLTDAQRKRVDDLRAEMKGLAPPRPFEFDMEKLGIYL